MTALHRSLISLSINLLTTHTLIHPLPEFDPVVRVLPREDHRDNVLGADNSRARGVDAVPEQLPPSVSGPLVHRQPGVVAGVGVLQVKLIKRDLDLGAGGDGDGPGVGEGLGADQQQGVQRALYQPLAAGQLGPVQQRVVGDKASPGPRLCSGVKLDPQSVGCCQVGGGCGATIPSLIQSIKCYLKFP